MSTYFEDKTFEKRNCTHQPLPAGVYENCHFLQCNLAGANISAIHFVDCRFEHCDASMLQVQKTVFRDVAFTDCKLLGIYFHNCQQSLFSPTFTGCLLNMSSFQGCKIKKTYFSRCELRDVDFTDADLSGSVFDDCNLERAIFANTRLDAVDLRSAYNFSINPTDNYLKKAQFSLNGLPGLLQHVPIIIS